VHTAPEQERPSGLPAEVSSLVGRGPQIAAVLERLHAARVVTLSGPGGCGKTRLALRVATLAEAGFRNGARLAELAPLTDPGLVPVSVAQVLQVAERATSPTAGLVRVLADREVLIVLDNCEHVLQAAASLVVALLERCRGVRILTTSRERLDVPGEFVFPVPPLELPEDGSACAVVASEAGLLFTARARAADPAFTVTADNSAAIAELCTRLDGMPLAIELAAARCPALGPEQLAARLEGHPGLLSGGPARPGRHQSLQALVAWSYELLDDAERRLLARLSVLRGGFDLDTAERVAAGGPLPPQAIAGLLASLAGKSVVQIQTGATVRYSLLETIRQFAADRLAESGEQTAVHLRLLRWALDMARSAEATLASADWPAWASRLSAEQANMRAALSWALGGHQPEAGRELAARLARWWIATGRYSEGGQFLTMALGIPAAAAPDVQARVLLGAAWSAYNLGDTPRAARLADEGIACAQQAGIAQLEIWGRNLLGGLAWQAGDADRVRALLKPGTGVLEEADRALAARAYVLLANAALLSGDLAESQRHGHKAVELARAAPGQEGLALALTAGATAAIAGAGILPSTQAALDEAEAVASVHTDRFSETIMRSWRARLLTTLGQLEAAETEVRLCWAVGREGAVRLVEFLGPMTEAHLAIAVGDSAAAIGALSRAADSERQVGLMTFVPTTIAARACLAAIAGDEPAAAAAIAGAHAALSGRREAITQAMLTCAEGIMAWHRGELAEAERLIRSATLQWHRCSDRMNASDGIELLGALAAARERYRDAARLLAAADAARHRLLYLTPGFTADRRAAARAASHTRTILGEDGFARAWEQGQGLTLDDAVAYAARGGGGRKRPAAGWAASPPPNSRSPASWPKACAPTPSPGGCSSPPAQSRCTSPTSSPSSASRPVPNWPHRQSRGPEDRPLSSSSCSCQPTALLQAAAGIGELGMRLASAARRARPTPPQATQPRGSSGPDRACVQCRMRSPGRRPKKTAQNRMYCVRPLRRLQRTLCAHTRQDAHPLERQSRCVTIAGRGHRARSA
jgi:predicted ATPase